MNPAPPPGVLEKSAGSSHLVLPGDQLESQGPIGHRPVTQQSRLSGQGAPLPTDSLAPSADKASRLISNRQQDKGAEGWTPGHQAGVTERGALVEAWEGEALRTSPRSETLALDGTPRHGVSHCGISKPRDLT